MDVAGTLVRISHLAPRRTVNSVLHANLGADSEISEKANPGWVGMLVQALQGGSACWMTKWR